MRALFTCALLLAVAGPAAAQGLPAHPTSLDSVLRHIGNNLFGSQCGDAELRSITDARARTERNRRVALFGLSGVLAIAGAVALHLDVLAKLGLASPSTGGFVVTGLLIASGADPIRELLKGARRAEKAQSLQRRYRSPVPWCSRRRRPPP